MFISRIGKCLGSRHQSPLQFHSLTTSIPSTAIRHPHYHGNRFFARFSADEEKLHRELEQWGKSFRIEHIPREQLDFSFVRSSGPGGQNVNKVSSKAQLKFRLQSASWMNPLVRDKLGQKYPRYITDKGDVLIMSDVHRVQTQNVDECVKRLYECIQDCCTVPKATSEDQKKKVEKLIKIAKQKEKEHQQKMRDKKSDRRMK